MPKSQSTTSPAHATTEGKQKYSRLVARGWSPKRAAELVDEQAAQEAAEPAVTVKHDGELRCNCKTFAQVAVLYGDGSCTHVRAVELKLAAEKRQATALQTCEYGEGGEAATY